MTTNASATEPKRSGLTAALWIVGALVIAGIVAVVVVKRAGNRGASSTAASAEEPPVAVTTVVVTDAEVPVTQRLAGSLRGNRETDLAANVSGRVVSTAVERGSKVKAGQVLAKIDVREAALAARQARAEADTARVQEDQAKIECDRYEKLKARGAVTDAEYQARITQCRTLPLTARAASARASLAAKNVGDGVVRAPFAGVVTERYVEVGQFVRDDSRVVTIVTLDQLRLEFAVPEADLAKVSEGMSVGFEVAAFPDKSFDAKVRFISGAVRAATRDLTVEAVVENPEGLLKSGMFADVELVTGKRKLPTIPKAAIVERDDNSHAFFVVDGRLEERVLSLGASAGDRVGVLKGARAGEQVAVGDVASLVNGQRAISTAGAP